MNLCGTGRCCRSRPDRFAKLGKNPGIDRIALRTVFSVGKVAHPRRLDHTHWLTSLVQRTHQGGFVTTSGFQNHMHFGSSLCLLSISQKLQNASVILGLIGQVVNNSAQMQFECGLGNVDSGVNYGKIIVGNIVLTHTCKCEPRAGASGARSINGSSLEQWMRMPLAPGRIATLTRRMQGAIAAHPHHRRTGCSPCGGLASLPAFADQRNKHSRHTRGDGMLGARFPQPLAGAWANAHDTKRWFAPPANVQCPFGTSRSLSSTNSRYALRSSRLEVEDFAKQILPQSGISRVWKIP